MEPTANKERRPQLLVSVRDAAEAAAALEGGCDLLDVKDPTRGSLGMAPVSVIADCIAASRGGSSVVPVSAALGETCDCRDSSPVPEIPMALSYAKLGTAQLGANGQWMARWRAARQRFEEAAHGNFGWIAVAYVDWQLANSMPPQAVADAAIAETEMPASISPHPCVGVLLDTFTKKEGMLFDWMTLDELAALAAQLRSAGLALAVAGRLDRSALRRLIPIAPDIIAIRSAACRNSERNGEISADEVRRFREALFEVFPEQHPHT